MNRVYSSLYQIVFALTIGALALAGCASGTSSLPAVGMSATTQSLPMNPASTTSALSTSTTSSLAAAATPAQGAGQSPASNGSARSSTHGPGQSGYSSQFVEYNPCPSGWTLDGYGNCTPLDGGSGGYGGGGTTTGGGSAPCSGLTCNSQPCYTGQGGLGCSPPQVAQGSSCETAIGRNSTINGSSNHKDMVSNAFTIWESVYGTSEVKSQSCCNFGSVVS